jgi:hypothetical protein
MHPFALSAPKRTGCAGLINSRCSEGGARFVSRCIVPAAREKKLIAAGRRQNIGPARKGEKEREEKKKKEREKEEKFAKKKSRGLRPRADPALDKKRRTPCGRSAPAKK